MINPEFRSNSNYQGVHRGPLNYKVGFYHDENMYPFEVNDDGRGTRSLHEGGGVRWTVVDSAQRPKEIITCHIPFGNHKKGPKGKVTIEFCHTTPHIDGADPLQYHKAKVVLGPNQFCRLESGDRIVHAEDPNDPDLLEVEIQVQKAKSSRR